MTDKINELMMLITHVPNSAHPDDVAQHESKVRTALEAALKPGEPDKVAALQSIVDSNTGFKRNTAPPAQTPVPPRLTTEQIESCIPKGTCFATHAFARAIESAVRAQFGVNDD